MNFIYINKLLAVSRGEKQSCELREGCQSNIQFPPFDCFSDCFAHPISSKRQVYSREQMEILVSNIVILLFLSFCFSLFL